VGYLPSAARSEGYSPRVQANSKFARPGARELLHAHARCGDGGINDRCCGPNRGLTRPGSSSGAAGHGTGGWFPPGRSPVQNVAHVAADSVVRTVIERMIDAGTATLHSFARSVVAALPNVWLKYTFEAMSVICFTQACVNSISRPEMLS
jgi:hypothetical protein